jgi:hypothetical protein
LIHYIDKDIDAAFIKSSIANASFDTPQAAKDNLNIFLPLYGTSITVIPDTLSKAGYSNVNVEEQSLMVHSHGKISNPEEPEALTMACISRQNQC